MSLLPGLKLGSTHSEICFKNYKVTLCKPLPAPHMYMTNGRPHILIIDEHLDNQGNKQNAKNQNDILLTDSIFHAYNKYLSVL